MGSQFIKGVNVIFLPLERSISALTIFLIAMLICAPANSARKNTLTNKISQGAIISPEPGFSGTWVTKHICNSKSVYGLLTIDSSRSKRAKSQLMLMQGSNVAVLELRQSIENNGHKVDLIADEWLYKSDSHRYARQSGILGINISAELDSSGLELHGNIYGDSRCSSFIGHKYVRYDKKIKQKGKINLNSGADILLKLLGGTRVNGRRAGANKTKSIKDQQCRDLFVWQQDNQQKLIDSELRFDSIVADDPKMLSMFGKTYDNWTVTDARAYKEIFSNCLKQLSGITADARRRDASRRIVETLTVGYGSREAAQRSRQSITITLGRKNRYEHEANGWSLKFYAISSARVANRHAYHMLESAKKAKPNQSAVHNLREAIDEFSDSDSILRFLSASVRTSYTKMLRDRESELSFVLLKADLEHFRFDQLPGENALRDAVLKRNEFQKIAKNNNATDLSKQIENKYVFEMADISKSERKQLENSLTAIPVTHENIHEIHGSLLNLSTSSFQYLLSTDKSSVTDFYSNHISQSLIGLSLSFLDWLTDDITMSRAGLDRLDTLTEGILGISVFALNVDSIDDDLIYFARLLEKKKEQIFRRFDSANIGGQGFTDTGASAKVVRSFLEDNGCEKLMTDKKLFTKVKQCGTGADCADLNRKYKFCESVATKFWELKRYIDNRSSVALAQLISDTNSSCVRSKESCFLKCSQSPRSCPGGSDAAYQRGVWKKCSEEGWGGKSCQEQAAIYGRLDQNIPISIPPEFQSLFSAIESGDSFEMNELNMVFVSGLGSILIKECNLLTGEALKKMGYIRVSQNIELI